MRNVLLRKIENLLWHTSRLSWEKVMHRTGEILTPSHFTSHEGQGPLKSCSSTQHRIQRCKYTIVQYYNYVQVKEPSDETRWKDNFGRSQSFLSVCVWVCACVFQRWRLTRSGRVHGMRKGNKPEVCQPRAVIEPQVSKDATTSVSSLVFYMYICIVCI